MEILDPTNQY
nr:millepattes peptide 3 [Nasonia vitripennis]